MIHHHDDTTGWVNSVPGLVKFQKKKKAETKARLLHILHKNMSTCTNDFQFFRTVPHEADFICGKNSPNDSLISTSQF